MSRDNRRLIRLSGVGLLLSTVLLCCGCAHRETQAVSPIADHPLWLSSDARWIDPPTGVDAMPVSVDAHVLYFAEDGRFRLVAAEMIKSAGDSVVIGAAGHSYLEGVWNVREGRVLVWNRSTYRDIPIVGESTPGEVCVDTLSFAMDANGDHQLTFRKRIYAAFDKLDTRSMSIAKACWDSSSVRRLLDSVGSKSVAHSLLWDRWHNESVGEELMPKLRHHDDLGTARFVTFGCYRGLPFRRVIALSGFSLTNSTVLERSTASGSSATS